MDMLRNWSARRSGGRITIKGFDVEDGHAVKISNVDLIEIDVLGAIVATDKDGDRFQLLARPPAPADTSSGQAGM